MSCIVYDLGPVLSQICSSFQGDSLDSRFIPFNFQLYNMSPVPLSAKVQHIHTLQQTEKSENQHFILNSV